ncbi:MAG: hypothetical protein WAU70_04215, partial [Flavobacteriales bacterium]
IGRTRTVDPAIIRAKAEELIAAANSGDGEACVRLMKDLVPEYQKEQLPRSTFDAPSPANSTTIRQ